MITIWKTISNNKWRSGYGRVLKAKGYETRAVKDILYRMEVYVKRLNDSPFKTELSSITDITSFKNKLDAIFNERWQGYIKESYQDMYEHFVSYLDILDTLEAIHGDFINDEEKKRIAYDEGGVPGKLGQYENPYVNDKGKLTALMRPFLLYSIKKRMDAGTMNMTDARVLCYNFYHEVLPEMTHDDYKSLLDDIWSSPKRIRQGIRGVKYQISFSDNTSKSLGMFEAVKEVILFYGSKKVYVKRLTVSRHRLLLRLSDYVVDPNSYDDLDETYKIFKNFKVKDADHVIHLVNRLFGNKLKVKMIVNNNDNGKV